MGAGRERDMEDERKVGEMRREKGGRGEFALWGGRKVFELLFGGVGGLQDLMGQNDGQKQVVQDREVGEWD